MLCLMVMEEEESSKGKDVELDEVQSLTFETSSEYNALNLSFYETACNAYYELHNHTKNYSQSKKSSK